MEGVLAFCEEETPRSSVYRYLHMVYEFNAEIVEVEIGGVAIYRLLGKFCRAKSYCHLYGAQGQRQAYF
ncbi:hypothetical protein TNCV_1716061 [Trichonephila clavipes]|nr:hypothetical protein TNCV_1716061 [Trichonephila clavipes]